MPPPEDGAPLPPPPPPEVSPPSTWVGVEPELEELLVVAGVGPGASFLAMMRRGEARRGAATAKIKLFLGGSKREWWGVSTGLSCLSSSSFPERNSWLLGSLLQSKPIQFQSNPMHRTDQPT